MSMPWYYFLISVVVEALLLWISDKVHFIKSKELRYFIVIFVYSFVFWIIYDLFLAPKYPRRRELEHHTTLIHNLNRMILYTIPFDGSFRQ